MSVLCPNGHSSESTDYCDLCGAPIAAPTPAPAAEPAPVPAPDPAASAGTTTCPHCGAPASALALFCENCGYDFTTGTAPVAEPGSDPAPATGGPPVTSAPAATAASTSGSGAGEGGPAAPATGSGPAVPAPAEGDAAALPTPEAPGPDTWVAELWVDPDWYASQQAEDRMPSVGLPTLVPLRARSVLVGRTSASRGIHPQVDCGTDSGVSRRHCQLNTDGTRWWVEDLQSSNGTYVAKVGEPLPDDPIAVGQRRELEDGDRLYLGAWTRIVVRRALEGEV